MSRNNIYLCVSMLMVLCLLFPAVRAQDTAGMHTDEADPVHIITKLRWLGGRVYEVHVLTRIARGWHIYAQVQPDGAVSVPTSVRLTSHPLVRADGVPHEVGRLQKQEMRDLGIVQNIYSDSVDFVQTIVLKAAVAVRLSGTMTYQACTDEQCLPPRSVTLVVTIPKK